MLRLRLELIEQSLGLRFSGEAARPIDDRVEQVERLILVTCAAQREGEVILDGGVLRLGFGCLAQQRQRACRLAMGRQDPAERVADVRRRSGEEGPPRVGERVRLALLLQ